MKNFNKLFAFAIVILGFSAPSFAQVSATATATGTIVTPIAITKNTDLNFGDAAVNATSGTVVLSTDGTRSRTGGVTLPTVTGTVAAAEFTITGTSGYAYTFTLPSSAITVSSGSNNMVVDTWTSNSTGTLTGGTEVVKVGATLNVNASQAAGTYVSGTPFTVSVNYN